MKRGSGVLVYRLRSALINMCFSTAVSKGRKSDSNAFHAITADLIRGIKILWIKSVLKKVSTEN